MADLIGTQIAGYRILRLLGRGYCKGYRPHCGLEDPGSEYADGAGVSMLCHDEAPFVERNALPSSGPFAEVYGRNPFLQACGAWNVGSASALTHTPVTTSIPILILHGMYDGYYPPSTATEGARALRRSFVYTIPGFGSAARCGT